jgi:hypothetical protein
MSPEIILSRYQTEEKEVVRACDTCERGRDKGLSKKKKLK